MLTLKAEKRDKKLKPSTLRKEGKLPAVFYGGKERSTPIAISQGDFLKVWKEAGESTIISLQEEGKDRAALIYDVQIDPVKGVPEHVDFYIVEADKEVEVDIPLEFIGVTSVVKDLGGTLVKVLHEIKVASLPKDLPHAIEVDISLIKTLEDQITVKDLKIPATIRLLADPDEVVALITVAKAEEEMTAEEFDVSKIEVEKKGKEEEVPEESADAEKDEKKGKKEKGKE
ncbi:MAG TPA: 50S ribosomal protein L25 [Candidatus Paceibacterota bacterium]